jgi:hypothetical protein
MLKTLKMIQKPLPPFGRREETPIEPSEDAVSVSRDQAIHGIGNSRRDDRSDGGENCPSAAELRECVQHGLRPCEEPLARRLPVRDHVHRVQIGRVAAVLDERVPSDRILKRRKANASVTVPREEKLVPAVAETADAVVEDNAGASRARFRRHEPYCGMYFQLRCLPSASHSTDISMRFLRVASVLASVTHSTYSRLALGLNASKAGFSEIAVCAAIAGDGKRCRYDGDGGLMRDCRRFG